MIIVSPCEDISCFIAHWSLSISYDNWTDYSYIILSNLSLVVALFLPYLIEMIIVSLCTGVRIYPVLLPNGA